ncbi:NADP-dependent oxidoreductase [Streptomyces sp. RFCAC02]|uniref:NADP-dependent oxidoreductase n=1 Tax=Streptomyces sp. RFCAC02 TaxID=2499143 RepID=UPI00101ED78E|nr:NADP-dependent oxidoreductase [Streptomyces sp. RFCAC02]
MRAVVQRSYGPPDVLEVTDVPLPEPAAGRIRVRVEAAGVNPTDWKHRDGTVRYDGLPVVPGWDVAGVVDRIGYGVTLFEEGDEVFGMLPYPDGPGAYVEYAVGPARAFARRPEGLDAVHAAALPLAGLTALQSLDDTARLREGQKVLVQAAAGGVGHLAVQIAKALGAYVYATASAGKQDFLTSLGADRPVDYRAEDVREVAGGVDAALVPMAGTTRTHSLEAVRDGGTLVTLLGGTPDEELAAARARGVRHRTLLVEHDHHGMRRIAALVRDGLLVPHVQQVFPLAEAAEAHRAGETGRTAGKLVLTVP